MSYIGYLIICIILSIFDIVIGSIWDHCYLNDNRVNLYLILSGSFLLTTTIISIVIIILEIRNKDYESLNEVDNNLIQTLLALPAVTYMSILIWGMSILWGTHIHNCNEGQYNYAYYRTIVVIFLIVTFVSLYMLSNCVKYLINHINNQI
jgi:hypothetical protein